MFWSKVYQASSYRIFKLCKVIWLFGVPTAQPGRSSYAESNFAEPLINFPAQHSLWPTCAHTTRSFSLLQILFHILFVMSVNCHILSGRPKLSYKSCLHGNHKRIDHLIKTCLVSWENAKVVSWENIQTLVLIDLLLRNFLVNCSLQKIMILREIWLFYYFPKTTFLLWLSKWIQISLNVQV